MIEPPSRGEVARPSMIGRSMSAYDGPYSSMITPLRVDQVHRGAEPADAHRPPLVNEISSVDGSTRRIVARSTHGDDSSFCLPLIERHRQDVLAAQAVDQRQHFAGRQPLVAAHRHVADLQRRGAAAISVTLR